MKRINIFESQLSLLNEGMTDITFHYCSFESLYNILKDGDIKLTMSSNKSDSYHKTKLFYLSTQRSKSLKLGYANNSRNECRIELDGYKLKSDGYESMPVDYWGALMGKQSDIGLNSPRMKVQYGDRVFDSQEDRETILKSQGKSSNFEFEDRIFSEKPYLSLKYVKRVDCMITNTHPMFKAILQLANKSNVGVFFYNNEKDFILQTNNTINKEIEAISGNYEEEQKYTEERRQRSLVDKIATLCGMLYYFEPFGDKVDEKVMSTLKQFGLESFYESVIQVFPKKKMWADTLCHSIGNDVRKLNTDTFTKNKYSNSVMLLAQYVLNTYGVNNFESLALYYEKRKKDEINKNKPDNITEDSVKCIMVSYYYDWNHDYDVVLNKCSFWKWFDKNQFYDEITRQIDDDEWNQQYGEAPVIRHKSKNNESFKKYIQHLMYNDNLSLYDGSVILCKIYNNNWEKMGEAFGRIVKPLELNRDNYFEYEFKITLSDRIDVENKLFRNFSDMYDYRQAWKRE